MEFQIGTNWSYYSHYVGDIFGAPLAIEGLMAFFLESTFIGLFFFGYPGAACLAVLHRSANVLDALWGKKNEKYIRFGTFAARLDDALNFVPARLSLPCIAFASRIIPNLRHNDILPVGWKYRTAHESPNSAWSEAAFAAAQLQHDGVVVAEKVAAPAPLEGMVAVEYLVEFGLYETVESQILAESAEFIFAHCLYWLFAIWMPTASTPSTGRQGVIVRW